MTGNPINGEGQIRCIRCSEAKGRDVYKSWLSYSDNSLEKLHQDLRKIFQRTGLICTDCRSNFGLSKKKRLQSTGIIEACLANPSNRLFFKFQECLYECRKSNRNSKAISTVFTG